MLANVGMWLRDDVANHEMLIFVGPQGIYKTTFFRRLLPQELSNLYWENNHNSFKSKDDKIALGENCLVEVEEFNITKPDDVGEMKSLITAQNIKERRPYARQREEKHRLAGFCGTCNEQHFLTDDTGNRRFLCFLVRKIVHPDEWGVNFDQLYAQLRDEFKNGERFWFNHEEEQRLELQNDEFRLMSDEEMLILNHFRKPKPGEVGEWMNSASIGQHINGGRLGYGISTKKIGSVLTRRKFPFKHDSTGNFYMVIEINHKQKQTEDVDDNPEPEQKQPQQTELPF
jgi:predicted P-loop ATPase